MTGSPKSVHTYNAAGDRTGDSSSSGTSTKHWWLGFFVKYESSAGAGIEVLLAPLMTIGAPIAIETHAL